MLVCFQGGITTNETLICRVVGKDVQNAINLSEFPEPDRHSAFIDYHAENTAIVAQI